jgi:3D (Asp-Asp-Asp) domain-containing protein
LLAVTLAAAAYGYAWAAKHVTVLVDGVRQECFSLRLTVRGILADAGIELHERDRVSPQPDERVGDGAKIVVLRAFPVTFRVDGKEIPSLTAQQTVAAAVSEAGIALGEHDRTEPPLDAAPLAGMAVRIVRVNKEFETKLWRVARKITRSEDDSLPLGLTRVIEKGKDGTEAVTFCITYEDGRRVGQKIVERAVVEAPIAETVVVGTSGEIVRDGETIRFRKAMHMTATAYYWGPECTGKWADGYTYTGLKAEKGVIAVDPRVIPLGTKVFIDGYGYAIAADIGSAIKGNIIDLCYDTLAEARAWGRRKVNLYILW